MKKYISIVIAFAMLFGVAVVVLAQDAPTSTNPNPVRPFLQNIRERINNLKNKALNKPLGQNPANTPNPNSLPKPIKGQGNNPAMTPGANLNPENKNKDKTKLDTTCVASALKIREEKIVSAFKTFSEQKLAALSTRLSQLFLLLKLSVNKN